MRTISLLLLLASVLLFGCTGQQQQPSSNSSTNSGTAGKRLKIGFAMDTLKEERWVRDRDAFEAQCKKMDVDCVITVADNKADKQANDVDNLLTQGVDALVIAPNNATQAASMVEKAKARGIPVVSLNVNPDGLLDGQGIGLVCGTEEALYQNVKRLLDNPQLVRTMGERSRAFAIKEFSEANIDRIATLLGLQPMPG